MLGLLALVSMFLLMLGAWLFGAALAVFIISVNLIRPLLSRNGPTESSETHRRSSSPFDPAIGRQGRRVERFQDIRRDEADALMTPRARNPRATTSVRR
jgi:hypothetical protein